MIQAFSVTDVGRTRQCNQDFIYSTTESIGSLDNLFLLADGMGGHRAGDFAARCAIEKVYQKIAKTEELDVKSNFEEAIQIANRELFFISSTEAQYRGMGTTLVCATIADGKAVIANVGDSRLYKIRGEEIEQITVDHSFVEELIAKGGIQREEARNHPKRNFITRAVGVASRVEIDFFTTTVEEGDQILLCSDGLTNMLTDQEIAEVMKENSNIEVACQDLMDQANAKGGLDNISIILVQVLSHKEME